VTDFLTKENEPILERDPLGQKGVNAGRTGVIADRAAFFREICGRGVVYPRTRTEAMQRDTEEFIELLTGAQTSVFGYIMSLSHDHARAQDILQETNLTIWRKAEDYEPGTNFTAWACRIAYYHVLNHRRKYSREQLVFDEEVFDYLAERQEQRSDGADARLRALRHCVGELPPKQRDLINRRYEPGASVKVMADEDGSTEGAVSQALFRIRNALQKCIERRIAAEGSGVRFGGPRTT
jgi:RNA polymerase sigma-70 factor, ECF subfamily